MKQKVQFVRESYSGLPPWARGIVAVVVVGGLAYIAWKAKDLIKKFGEGKESRDVVSDAANEVKVLQNQYKLSRPKSAYSSCIENIVKLLSGCETPNSETAVVENIIKVVKNPLDWAYLVQQFGTKTIPDCGWGSTQYSLPALLKDQLDSWACYAIPTYIDGYKLFGCKQNTIDFLTDYLNTKKITI